MGICMEKQNNSIDLSEPIEEILSPRDPNFAIQFFADSLRKKIAHVDSFVSDVYGIFIKNTPIASQIVCSLEKGSRFVVDMTDSTKKAIDKGFVKLVTEHGKLKAQLRDANGHYGAKLDIKEEIFRKGIDVADMATALQLKALQEMLQQVADQILSIIFQTAP